MRFRVLIGEFLSDGPEGCECEACTKSEGKNHRYRAQLVMRNVAIHPETLQPITASAPYAGDVVESEADLCAQFNRGVNSRKFERMEDAPLSSAQELVDAAKRAGIDRKELLALFE